MKRLLWMIPFLGMVALSTSCEGRYRYSCQDPANWKKTECNNETCAVVGSCTNNLLSLPKSDSESEPDLEKITE